MKYSGVLKERSWYFFRVWSIPFSKESFIAVKERERSSFFVMIDSVVWSNVFGLVVISLNVSCS